MTETDLAASVRNRTAGGMYFFYGDEDYLKNYRAGEMRAMVTEDAPEFAAFNTVELTFGDGELDLGALSDALLSPPVFAARKFVSVHFPALDAFREKERSSLLELLSGIAEDWRETGDDSVLLVVKASSGGFDPGAPKKPSAFLAAADRFMKCVSFDVQSDAKLVKWLARHCQDWGVTLPSDCAARILASAGKSMYVLSGEIEKIAAYTAARGASEVTPADVDACVIRTDEDDAFGLANCILSGDVGGALSVLGVKIRKKEDPIFLLAQITKVFGDLCCASMFLLDGRDKSDFAKTMRMHEYRAGLYFRAAKQRTPGFFTHAIDLCRDADRQLKTSSGDYAPLEKLICLFTEYVEEPEEGSAKETP